MSVLAAVLALIVPLAEPTPEPRSVHRQHHHRRHHAPPMHVALASWYDDAGTTASGTHYVYGYASLMFGSSWGHVTHFCYGRRCVDGRLDDHGPYVYGRSFDLNWSLKTALGCPDLCWVRWR